MIVFFAFVVNGVAFLLLAQRRCSGMVAKRLLTLLAEARETHGHRIEDWLG
jgi:hypothetical protein